MIVLITYLNILCLFIGICWLNKKHFEPAGNALLVLTSGLLLLISLSMLYFLMLVLNQSYFILQGSILVINLVLFYACKNEIKYLFKGISFNYYGVLALMAVVLFTFYFIIKAEKYGQYDAFSTWNFHAKYLYELKEWRHLFTDLSYSHTDYPLFIPSLVAFFWKGINQTSPFVPYILSYVTLICIPLLIFYSLLKQGLNLFAFLSLLIFLSDNVFKLEATAQEADVLLSLLFLFTFVKYHDSLSKLKNVYLLGFVCAACASVKNEGIAFYLFFTLFFVLSNIKNFTTLKKYFFGALIPTLAIIYFKLFLAPPSELIPGNLSQSLILTQKVLSLGRYVKIFQFMFITVINQLSVLVLILVVFIFNRKAFIKSPLVVVILMAGAYFIIYLITPYDLPWHLGSSIDRLLLQIYPSIIYLSLLSLASLHHKYLNINRLGNKTLE